MFKSQVIQSLKFVEHFKKTVNFLRKSADISENLDLGGSKGYALGQGLLVKSFMETESFYEI